MRYLNSLQYRAINRRGLYDSDGRILQKCIIHSAYHGSIIDLDVCHLAVRDMIFNMCASTIDSMLREFDLENNVWSTKLYDECGRYTDDILHDWRATGFDTYLSIHDTTSMYINEILACPKPDRTFDSDKDFIFTLKHGTIPKTLDNPARPVPYRLGDGHRTEPDGVGHPLLAHMETCVPKGLLPHNKSGCGFNYKHMQKQSMHESIRPVTITQPKKEQDVRLLVKDMAPDAAYMLNSGSRHDILLYGDVDAHTVFNRVDYIQKLHNTPLNCLILKNDTLLHDEYGNDAKKIITSGTCLTGSLDVSGKITPPRPAALSDDELIVNLDRYGFSITVHDMPGAAARIRPEYVIAASFFTNEPRWYVSGTAVLICRSEIDWGLMLYLAKIYRFEQTLHGILKSLATEGHVYDLPLYMMRGCGALKIISNIHETLRVYGLLQT